MEFIHTGTAKPTDTCSHYQEDQQIMHKP